MGTYYIHILFFNITYRTLFSGLKALFLWEQMSMVVCVCVCLRGNVIHAESMFRYFL